MNLDEKQTKLKERQEIYRFRVNTLLTLIGLWLALPATCGLLQRMTDNLTSLDAFSKNMAIIIKLTLDSFLLVFYIIGLLLLLFIGFTGLAAVRAKAALEDTVRENAPRVIAVIGRNKPGVEAAIKTNTPRVLVILNTLMLKGISQMKRLLIGLINKFTTLQTKPEKGAESILLDRSEEDELL